MAAFWPRDKTRRLKNKIGAIQVAKPGASSLGLFTELPEGARIEICDAGFNDDTVKVGCHTHFYFVFRRDVGL